jgi:transitional endoplasmic reticulum ATPase
MQEAFVAALLAIARASEARQTSTLGSRSSGESVDEWVEVYSYANDDLDDLVLWVEIKKQIDILRQGMDQQKENESSVV